MDRKESEGFMVPVAIKQAKQCACRPRAFRKYPASAAVWIALAVAGILAAPGCKKKATEAPVFHGSAPVDLPPPATDAASTDDVYEKQKQQILAELEPIESLGKGSLAKTAGGENWTQYPSGIMIQELLTQNGIPPQYGQMLSIAYRELTPAAPGGQEKLIKEQTADNPWKFRLGSKSVIKGLNMALATMKTGSRRRIFIPANLAYGEAGEPELGIGPNQPLIFEVELMQVTGEGLEMSQPQSTTPELIGPPAPPATAPKK